MSGHVLSMDTLAEGLVRGRCSCGEWRANGESRDEVRIAHGAHASPPMTGPELRALRDRLGYSLTRMAEATGVSVSTLCRYQSGALAIPRTFEVAAKSLRKRVPSFKV